MVSSLDNWDGSLSKSVKQKTVRMTDSSAGTSTVNKTVPMMIRPARQDMMTAQDVDWTNNASNSNQPLSRDGLVQGLPGSPPLTTVASQSGITNSRKNLLFTPVASSPLHNRTLGYSSVAPTVIDLTLPDPVTSKGDSPPATINLDTLDTISIYTADGEGEDENEVEIVDDAIVYDMLAAPASQTYYEQNLSRYSPLFTPPPEEDTRSVNQLFTPCPSPKQTQIEPSPVYRQPRPRRLIMSHIEMPPLKRPRSDYQPFQRSQSSIVSRRRVPSGPPPALQDVIQASLVHNSAVGTLPYNGLEKKRRKLTKKRNEGGEKIIVSRPSPMINPTGLAFETFRLGAPQVAGSAKKDLKRSLMDDGDGDWGAPPKYKKRPRLIPKPIVDLTLSDDDERPKVKPTPTPIPSISNPISRPLQKPLPSKFIHVTYDLEMDVVTLCLEDIRPVPLEVLTLNTQFLRRSLGHDIITSEPVVALGPKSAELNINCTRQNGSRPCFLSTTASSDSVKDAAEEISVGGVLWELPDEEIKKEVIEVLSDSDAYLKENVPARQLDVPSVPTSQVILSKPNVILAKQHQKKPRESHHSQQPKQRHQPKGDDVDRSSSTFNAPPDRAVPSSPKVTKYPKRGRPKKQKQVSLDGISGSITFDIPQEQVVPPSPLPSLVRPSHSARSSLTSQHPSGADHPNGVMPSAKALGKRRAISPTGIPATATTTPQRQLHPSVPAYFAASIHDLQMASHHHSSTSTPAHDSYVVQNSDFNAFFNYPSTITSAVQSPSAQVNGAGSINPSSLSSSYNPLDTLDSLYNQSSSSQNQSGSHIGASRQQLSATIAHTPTHSNVLVYNSQNQPESRGGSFFSSANSVYNDVGFSADQRDHQYDHERRQQYGTPIDDRWSSSLVTNHSEGQYEYDTIDPTLLGGGSPSVEVALVDAELDLVDAELDMVGLELELNKEIDDVVQRRGLGSGLSKESSPSPSSDDSSYSSPGPAQSKKIKSSLKPVSPASNHVSTEDQEEKTYERKISLRKRTKRVLPDMISHDDIDLLKSISRNRRLPSSSTNSSPDADKSDSDSGLESEAGSESDEPKYTVRKPIPKPKAKPSPKHPQLIEQKLTASRESQNQDWLTADFESVCHQCRRKTFYAKMTCSDCKKKFCVRCYAFRYPECEFDVNDKEYSCPACEGFCNCTVCCRKRGEPYVGVRTCDKVPDSPQMLAPRLQNRDIARVKLGSKTNLPPPSTSTVIPTTTIPQGATKAWGSLYSVTGEKIGACFFDPSAQKGNSVVFAPVTAPIMTTITEVAQQLATPAPLDQPKPQVKRKKRRIFIGTVQPHWGYTRPKIKLLKAEPYAKRSYDAMPRYYVGKKKCLFYPVEEDPESSLTSIEENEEVKERDDGVNLEGKSFSPDSLGDGDVMRAILLGLNACGVAAVEVPTI